MVSLHAKPIIRLATIVYAIMMKPGRSRLALHTTTDWG